MYANISSLYNQPPCHYLRRHISTPFERTDTVFSTFYLISVLLFCRCSLRRIIVDDQCRAIQPSSPRIGHLFSHQLLWILRLCESDERALMFVYFLSCIYMITTVNLKQSQCRHADRSFLRNQTTFALT